MAGSLPRRTFLGTLAAVGARLALPAGSSSIGFAQRSTLGDFARLAPVARWWVPVGRASCTDCHGSAELRGRALPAGHGRALKCGLCAHGCVLGEGRRGQCRARMNVGGELRSLVYGRPITTAVDPIEKKPFYHFLPGSLAFSMATAGCPLRCRFCQNWQISQASPEDAPNDFVPPMAIVERAMSLAPVLAFTYNEPTVFAEYLVDIATAARKRGLRCVLVSCGFMNEAPLREMIEVLDAIKIDLKGFSPEFYRSVTGAELGPVLRSIKQVAKAGRHLELVNLVVPTLNDSGQALSELVKWVAGELGPDVPLHFTRFHPDYLIMDLPPTPLATLERAWELAKAQGLRYAYVGNVPEHPGNHTRCPKCGALCIERKGIFITARRMRGSACISCGTKLAGVWS
jgi:pyruvate formate lyase activating enzyme